jgi:tetratricopeptide (TPR) repeat protein
MGLFLLAASVLMAIVRRHAKAGIAFIVVLACILAALAWDYNAKWQTQEKYSRYWLSLNIGNLTPYYGLGRSLMDQGDCAGAVKSFQEGIRILNTNNVYLLADAGHCFDVLGEDGAAAFFLNAATKEGPDYAMTYHYMGLYLMKRSDKAGAVRMFEKAVELDPKFSPSRDYLEKIGKPLL